MVELASRMVKQMKDKKLIVEIKPLLVVVTYTIILGTIVLNYQIVFGIIGTLFGYLKPLFIALGIAYVLNLPMKAIEKFILKRVNEKSKLRSRVRGISILITTILVLLVITAFFVLIAPQLIKSVTTLIENISGYVQNLVNQITAFLNENNINNKMISEQLNNIAKINWDDFLVSVGDWLLANSKSIGVTASKSIEQAVNNFVDGTLKFGGSFGAWITGIFISYYLLSSKEKFIRQARKLIATIFSKKQAEIIFRIGKQANQIYSNFITGKLLEAFIFSGIVLVVMTLLKMEYALLISLVILVASLIPVFGAIFAMCFGAFLIFSVNPIQAVWFIVVYQILKQLENNLIYPKVVGESVGLPGVWVLLSILVFGSMFGLLGMLLAVPTSALLYQLTCELINYVLKKKNIEISELGNIEKRESEEG